MTKRLVSFQIFAPDGIFTNLLLEIISKMATKNIS
jgi:hypothetical protein